MPGFRTEGAVLWLRCSDNNWVVVSPGAYFQIQPAAEGHSGPACSKCIARASLQMRNIGRQPAAEEELLPLISSQLGCSGGRSGPSSSGPAGAAWLLSFTCPWPPRWLQLPSSQSKRVELRDAGCDSGLCCSPLATLSRGLLSQTRGVLGHPKQTRCDSRHPLCYQAGNVRERKAL